MTEIPADQNYTVEPYLPGPKTPCDCPNCDWRGTLADLQPMGICCLTTGNIVPAGRCPQCSSLAFVEKDLVKSLAEALNTAIALRSEAKSLRSRNAEMRAEFEMRLEQLIKIGLGEKP